MKIDNLKRSIEVAEELTNIDKQIAGTKALKNTNKGFVISEHQGGTGHKMDYIYYKGKPALGIYGDILHTALRALENHRAKLVEEIETL